MGGPGGSGLAGAAVGLGIAVLALAAGSASGLGGPILYPPLLVAWGALLLVLLGSPLAEASALAPLASMLVVAGLGEAPGWVFHFLALALGLYALAAYVYGWLPRGRSSEGWAAAALAASIASSGLVAWLACSGPRVYTPDETTYVYHGLLARLEGVVPGFGVSPESPVAARLEGRYFWPLYIAGALAGSAASPLQAHCVSGSVVAGGLVASVYLLSTRLTLLRGPAGLMASLAAGLGGPLLFFYRTVLLEPLQAYLLVLITYHLGYVAERVGAGGWGRSAAAALVLTVAYLVLRPNPVPLGVLVLVVLLYTATRPSASMARLLSRLVLAGLAAYLAFIDAPYGYATYIAGDQSLADKLKPFLVVPFSVSEAFLGVFVEAPWDKHTIFTLPLDDKLAILGSVLGLDPYTPLVAGVVLLSPLLLAAHWGRMGAAEKVVVVSSFASIVVFYVLLVSTEFYEEVLRYAVVAHPLVVVSALALLARMGEDGGLRGVLYASSALLLGFFLAAKTLRPAVLESSIWPVYETSARMAPYAVPVLYILLVAMPRLGGRRTAALAALAVLASSAAVYALVYPEAKSPLTRDGLNTLLSKAAGEVEEYGLVMTNAYPWVRLLLPGKAVTAPTECGGVRALFEEGAAALVVVKDYRVTRMDPVMRTGECVGKLRSVLAGECSATPGCTKLVYGEERGRRIVVYKPPEPLGAEGECRVRASVSFGPGASRTVTVTLAPACGRALVVYAEHTAPATYKLMFVEVFEARPPVTVKRLEAPRLLGAPRTTIAEVYVVAEGGVHRFTYASVYQPAWVVAASSLLVAASLAASSSTEPLTAPALPKEAGKALMRPASLLRRRRKGLQGAPKP